MIKERKKQGWAWLLRPNLNDGHWTKEIWAFMRWCYYSGISFLVVSFLINVEKKIVFN